MKRALPVLAAGLMASCHPVYAIVVARPVVAARPAPAKASTPARRSAPVVVPVPAAPVRRATPCDSQPQPADCKR